MGEGKWGKMWGTKYRVGMAGLQALLLTQQAARAEDRARQAEAMAAQALRGEAGGDEKLLTVREVAAWLQVHEKTVYKWELRDGLPCKKVGNRIRFEGSAVSRWLQARREGV